MPARVRCDKATVFGSRQATGDRLGLGKVNGRIPVAPAI